VKFLDGLVITPEQASKALEHFFFGCGSIVDRRNHIIASVFDIEQDDKSSSRYRRGWDQGTFKRHNLPRLLLALAEHLLASEEDQAVA
jgi:hypothetical protein